MHTRHKRESRFGPAPRVPIETLKSLYESGLSSKKVGEAVGMKAGSVWQRLRNAGVTMRDKRGPGRSDVVPISDLIHMYESGLSLSQLAEQIGVTKAAVRFRLNRFGVRMRKQDDYRMPHGSEHPLWKGGRAVDPQGYVTVNVGPCKRKLEHRAVMEKILGRPLKRHEYVHHINGIRDDNRPENLVLTTPNKHESRTLIKALQRRICYLEAVLQGK